MASGHPSQHPVQYKFRILQNSPLFRIPISLTADPDEDQVFVFRLSDPDLGLILLKRIKSILCFRNIVFGFVAGTTYKLIQNLILKLCKSV